jgi:hypothetical protein
MALVKPGVLCRVFLMYSMLVISETVCHEVVASGSVIGARDASESRQILPEWADCNFPVR